LEGEGKAAASRFAEEALSGLTFILVLFSAVAMVAMPWLMIVLAPGFISDPAKYGLSVELTRITFPYLLCMSLAALLSGVLNSLQRFWAAAAAPILLNVVLISAMALAIGLGYANTPGAGYILAIGVVIAGVSQLAMLWIAVRRAGIRLVLRRPRYTDGMRRLVQLGIPGILSGGITQINIVVGTVIASLEAGAVSYLYYADRLYQLPLGIVGIAIGVVLLPDLARKLRAGEMKAALDSQNRSLEFALLLTLPAAVALAIAAEPIISVLFERGAFKASDTPATAWALAAFAAGLPAFVLIKVFQPAYFAREDTRTPMWFAAVNMAVNVVASLVLFFLFKSWGWMPHVGIAIATAIAGWLNAFMLWWVLARDGRFAPDVRLMGNLPLIVAASVVMGAVLWLALPVALDYTVITNPLYVRIASLTGLVVLGMVVFFGIVATTGVFGLDQLKKMLRRR
ncbi:MAG TPA: murein biosynthesis integral membrane protein MurJ, partial [Hyphomicrobiaceae bacterium]|nr:murein biosynthesis integral membrane protein MurJ [Hyphomicrobiaceae bacterium]